MTFDWRLFLKVFVAASLTSVITFLVIQYFQGQMNSMIQTVERAAVVGLGLALLFAMRRKRDDYPWM